MKIWCDVCDKEEAVVFCSADEAALCDGCDRRVHHANKLASKHTRFSLLHPNFKESPLCDICQERRAFLFCQEDRAILCRECDLPIHRANEHTQKHNRFLLTGVKLSSSSSFSSSSPALNPTSSSSNGYGATIDSETTRSRFCSVPNPPVEKPSPNSTANGVEDNYTSDNASSISEYLMETLPGWNVDDFLGPSSSANGFCKNYLFIPGNGLVDNGLRILTETNVLDFGCGWDDIDNESFLVPQISSSSCPKKF
ncbi:hypothetical protein PTKIN_Ptkin10aG0149800 [Pterospermum kingtungense]